MRKRTDYNQTRSPFSRARKRLRELERLISGRHGCMPETDDADVYLEPVVNCFHVIAASRDRSVSVDGIMKLFWFWCEEKAPHVDRGQAMAMVRREHEGPPELIADDIVGKALRLSYVERLTRNITAVGSHDADKAMRTKLAKDRRRERDRKRAAAKRRAKGAEPRAVYEANSLSQTKPWEQEGISRSTWERRRKKTDASASPHQTDQVDASPSPPRSSYKGRRTCVTSVTEQSPASKRGAPQASPRQHEAAEIGDGRDALGARPAQTPPSKSLIVVPPDAVILEGEIITGGRARDSRPKMPKMNRHVLSALARADAIQREEGRR